MSEEEKHVSKVEVSEFRGNAPMKFNALTVPSYFCDSMNIAMKGQGFVKLGFSEVMPDEDGVMSRVNVFVNLPRARIKDVIEVLTRMDLESSDPEEVTE